MLPSLQIGPLSIPTDAFILLVGLWVGLNVAERRSHRHQVKREVLFNLATIMLGTGLVGARFGYVARYPSIFFRNPSDIISRNLGLMDPHIGIFIGFLSALIYVQQKKLSFLAILDALSPAMSIMAIALGFAHLASGDAYGFPTTLPWGISLWGAIRHPSQIYEIMAASIIFLLTISGKTLTSSNCKGSVFFSFLAMTAFARLILDSFRGDSQLLIYGIRSMQVFSWVIFASSFWTLSKLRVKNEEVL